MHSTTTFIFALGICIIANAFYSQAALEVPEVVKKQVRKLHNRCMNETGVAEDLIMKAHSSGKLPDDTTFKCFLRCMFDMFGLIDSTNTMHLESLVEVLPEEMHAKILQLAAACATKHGIDGCDTAFKTVSCYIETDGAFIKSSIDDLLG